MSERRQNDTGSKTQSTRSSNEMSSDQIGQEGRDTTGGSDLTGFEEYVQKLIETQGNQTVMRMAKNGELPPGYNVESAESTDVGTAASGESSFVLHRMPEDENVVVGYSEKFYEHLDHASGIENRDRDGIPPEVGKDVTEQLRRNVDGLEELSWEDEKNEVLQSKDKNVSVVRAEIDGDTFTVATSSGKTIEDTLLPGPEDDTRLFDHRENDELHPRRKWDSEVKILEQLENSFDLEDSDVDIDLFTERPPCNQSCDDFIPMFRDEFADSGSGNFDLSVTYASEMLHEDYEMNADMERLVDQSSVESEEDR